MEIGLRWWSKKVFGEIIKQKGGDLEQIAVETSTDDTSELKAYDISFYAFEFRNREKAIPWFENNVDFINAQATKFLERGYVYETDSNNPIIGYFMIDTTTFQPEVKTPLDWLFYDRHDNV